MIGINKVEINTDGSLAVSCVLTDALAFTSKTAEFYSDLQKFRGRFFKHIDFLKDRESIGDDFMPVKRKKIEIIVEEWGERLTAHGIRTKGIKNILESIQNGIEKYRQDDSMEEIYFYERVDLKLKRFIEEIKSKMKLEKEASGFLKKGFTTILHAKDIKIEAIELNFSIAVSVDSDFYVDAMDMLEKNKKEMRMEILKELNYKKCSEGVNMLNSYVEEMSLDMTVGAYIAKANAVFDCWSVITSLMLIKSAKETSESVISLTQNVQKLGDMLRDIYKAQNKMQKYIRDRQREGDFTANLNNLTVKEALELQVEEAVVVAREGEGKDTYRIPNIEKTISLDSVYRVDRRKCLDIIYNWVSKKSGIKEIELDSYIGSIDTENACIYFDNDSDTFQMPRLLTDKIIEKGGSHISDFSFYSEEVIELRDTPIRVYGKLTEGTYSFKRKVV